MMRDRCGQQQRAWCGDHQHRHRPYRVTRHPPGRTGHDQGERDERAPRSGRPSARRGPTSPVPARPVGRSGCTWSQLLVSWPASRRDPRVDDARAHLVSGRSLDRVGFARERGLVEDGRSQQASVDGDDFAAGHQEPVATDDLLDGNEIELIATASTRGPGGAGDEQRELAFRAGLGPCLEQPTGRQHHGDDGAGEWLVHQDRAEQGQPRHDVDAHVPGTQLPARASPWTAADRTLWPPTTLRTRWSA